MKKAFVFGKFLPFHKGHEAMINFALSKCDFLTVLVCCSDKESVSGEMRRSWILETFKEKKNVEVKIFDYLESEFPNTSESSRDVSEIWAKEFKKIFIDHSLVITSEEYGIYVSEFMGIEHISFDIPRKMFPVSATAVRRDIFTNWKFLPDSVKPYFSIKVVILGTESTGKTTLSKKLSEHFDCNLVSEVGREMIPDSNSFDTNDLQLVAKEHSYRIEKAMIGKSPLVIVDTDVHITKSYSRFVLGKDLEVSKKIYDSNVASLYLYLNNDVEFVQDGTRLSEEDRNLLDDCHRKVLRDHGIKMVEIRGNWENRLEKAIEQVNMLDVNICCYV